MAFQWFICEGNLIVYHGFRNNRGSYFHQHWLSSNCRDERLLPHPLKLEMEQRLWVPNSGVCTSRCYCFAFIHIKVSFKTTQSMCELCWRLLLFSCMLGAIKCNNSIKNRHGEKILSFATSTEKWKWEKSCKKRKAIMPWPGFEPGLLRPQRRVLTTRRSRLSRFLPKNPKI